MHLTPFGSTRSVAKALEQYRSLQVHIQLWLDKSSKTLLITSALPQAGTSTISANLATLIAYSGHEVLVVDACVKRPQLSHIFGIRGISGLTSALQDPYKWEDAVKETRIARLWVMPSWQKEPNQLVDGAAIMTLLDLLRQRYGIVIIDGANIMDSADTLMWARVVDGVVLVVPSGRASRHVYLKALSELEYAHAPVIGSVLTQMRG